MLCPTIVFPKRFSFSWRASCHRKTRTPIVLVFKSNLRAVVYLYLQRFVPCWQRIASVSPSLVFEARVSVESLLLLGGRGSWSPVEAELASVESNASIDSLVDRVE